ncbi:EamA family transporter RarD [uncultured Cedecea sp.]|uniref:EamA family transporter RarD n=1 Tax=uncultured Cedecea sp. TaxID=988762 RepID=UPI0026379AA2|nr:EamA family transporter RarD [uncultured Cedecea sp.]
MNSTETRKGVLLALFACLIWGLAPVYFKFIQQVPALEILTHRVVWSFFFMVILLSLYRLWPAVKQVCRHPKKILALALTASLIGSNWLLYIWAVNNNHLLEASLGYFINPLVSVLLGIIFLGERFRVMQWAALLLAMTGVLVQLWTFGSLPIIALGLAFSFSFYSLLRKKIGVDAQAGMLIETLWLLPVASIYLFAIADSPTSDMTANSWLLNLLLIFAGVITTVPLLCFTAAANRLRLSTLGFFLYSGPILIFLLATLLYGEVVTQDKLVTFGFIWVALILFITDAIYTQRRARKALKAQLS